MKNDLKAGSRARLIITCIFSAAAMAVMILLYMHRDVSAGELQLTDAASPDGYVDMGTDIEDEAKSDATGCLEIPLENGITADDVTVSTNLISGETKICINRTAPDFYYRNPLSGSRTHMKSLAYDYSGKSAVIDIMSDRFLEADEMIKDNMLFLKLVTPREKYGSIILIDAGHGGDDPGTTAYGIREKDITLGVEKALMSMDTGGVELYFTRTQDENVTDDERLQYADGILPDAVISLHMNADAHTRVTSGTEILKNGEASGEMADGLEQLLTQALGTETVQNDSSVSDTVLQAKVPVYVAELGYMTNRTDAGNSSATEYQKKAASAIDAFIIRYISNKGR